MNHCTWYQRQGKLTVSSTSDNKELSRAVLETLTAKNSQEQKALRGQMHTKQKSSIFA